MFKKISLRGAYIFVFVVDVSIMLIIEKEVPGWFIIIGIIAGILLGWASTLKMWYENNSPWQPPKEIFKDDPKITDTVVNISFSKDKAMLGCLLGLGAIVFSVSLLPWVRNDLSNKDIFYKYLFSVNLLLFGIRLLYKKRKALYRSKPQLIINDKGLNAEGVGFYSWSEIRKLQFNTFAYRPFFNRYLIYYTPSGRIKIDATDFELNYYKLSHLLDVFRSRYGKNNLQ